MTSRSSDKYGFTEPEQFNGYFHELVKNDRSINVPFDGSLWRPGFGTVEKAEAYQEHVALHRLAQNFGLKSVGPSKYDPVILDQKLWDARNTGPSSGGPSRPHLVHVASMAVEENKRRLGYPYALTSGPDYGEDIAPDFLDPDAVVERADTALFDQPLERQLDDVKTRVAAGILSAITPFTVPLTDITGVNIDNAALKNKIRRHLDEHPQTKARFAAAIDKDKPGLSAAGLFITQRENAAQSGIPGTAPPGRKPG